MNQIIIAIIGSSALSALISGIFSERALKRRKTSGLENGMKILLHDRIKSEGKAYIAQGYVEMDDLKCIMEMHDIYHKQLDGNGFLDKIMQDVKALPIKENQT